MRIKYVLSAVTTVLAMALAGTPASADISLPTGNCGLTATNNCLVFDNFNVYSLAVLNQQQGYGSIGNGDPYDIGTNGTDLAHVLVVATGNTGNGASNTDIISTGGVDDAFNTPSAAGPGINNFLMTPQPGGTAGPQGATIVNNSGSTWDINTSDLVDYLAGGDLAFFFSLNQANSANTYLTSAQDALGWLSVTLTNNALAATETAAQCAADINCSVTFWLDGNQCDGGTPGGDPTHCDPGQSYAETNANNSILPSAPADHDEWAYIHGAVCMSPAGAIVGFGPCASGDHTNTTVNQNLSENRAAFALFSQALQAALTSGDYDKMSVDLRMAALTNGFENLVIFAAVHVPEPLTVALFGTGLLGLVMLRRRKQARA